MEKILIIGCRNTMDDVCIGCSRCLVAFNRREGQFARYKDQEAELLGILNCGGCPGASIVQRLAQVKLWNVAAQRAAHHDPHRPVPVRPLYPRRRRDHQNPGQVRTGGRRRHPPVHARKNLGLSPARPNEKAVAGTTPGPPVQRMTLLFFKKRHAELIHAFSTTFQLAATDGAAGRRPYLPRPFGF